MSNESKQENNKLNIKPELKTFANQLGIIGPLIRCVTRFTAKSKIRQGSSQSSGSAVKLLLKSGRIYTITFFHLYFGLDLSQKNYFLQEAWSGDLSCGRWETEGVFTSVWNQQRSGEAIRQTILPEIFWNQEALQWSLDKLDSGHDQSWFCLKTGRSKMKPALPLGRLIDCTQGFFLTFLQCVRIKMLKMFMFLSMPQSKLSMTSIKSNLNWIWRVSDLFYWELSPFTVWRWHAQENEHQSNVIQTEFGVSAFCFVKRTFTIRNLFPRFRKLDVGNNGYLQRQAMQLICTKRTRSSFDPNVLFLE